MAALSGTPTLQQPNSSIRTTRTTRAHSKLSTKLQLKLTSPSPSPSSPTSPSPSSPSSALLQPDLLQNNEFQELGATVLLSSQTTNSNSNSNRIKCNDNNNSKQMNLNLIKQQQKQQHRRNGHDVHLTENNNLYNIIPIVSDTTQIPPQLKERYKQIHSKPTTTTAATTASPNHIIDLSEQITTEEVQIKCEPIMATSDDQQQKSYSTNENLLNNNQPSSKNNLTELTTKGEIPVKSEVEEMQTTDDHSYNHNNNSISREAFPEAKTINIKRKSSQSNSDQPSDLTIKLTNEEEENRSKCQLEMQVSQNCNELNENSRGSITRPQIRLTPTSKLLAPMAVPKVPVNNAIAVIKKKYPCPYENCTKSYGKSSHLRSHLTWHTGIKPFVCKEPGCGKGFTRSDELNRHIRTHTGEKPFECVQCTKKFSRSDHLTKHLATHAKHLSAIRGGNKIEGGRRLKSTEKPTVVTPLAAMMPPANNDCQLMNLKKHLNYVDSVQFMAALVEDLKKRQTTTTANFITGESSLTKRPLKIKLERQDDSNEYHIVTTQTTITNPADYRKRKDRLQHNSSMTKQLNDTTAMASNMITSNNYINNFPSPIFDSEMKRERYRNIEYEEPDDDAIMPEANLPPYRHSPHVIAPTNLMNINNSNTIAIDNTTSLLYDPGRPFKCVWCMKFFKRQDDLNRHMRVHTGEKPFICNECDKGFKRSDHLKKHMNTHTRIR